MGAYGIGLPALEGGDAGKGRVIVGTGPATQSEGAGKGLYSLISGAWEARIGGAVRPKAEPSPVQGGPLSAEPVGEEAGEGHC